jgi:redox-sensitive bicupin YhaK (pirin superfamily)
MSAAAALKQISARQIVHRSRGRVHGRVTRLMSPGDLGETLKPFVFLDLFDNQGDRFPSFGLHPHSGIATLTYLAEGSVSYEDTNGAKGVLRAGGAEWMRAGKGVWHAGGAGDPERTRGFQLWVALPANLELGSSESVYQSAADIPRAGPAHVLLGSHDNATSAITAPSPMNCPGGQPQGW